MNDATVQGFRNFWSLANTETRTMTARDMALTSWGKVHENVNVNPADGSRWVWSERYNAFVCYGDK